MATNLLLRDLFSRFPDVTSTIADGFIDEPAIENEPELALEVWWWTFKKVRGSMGSHEWKLISPALEMLDEDAFLSLMKDYPIPLDDGAGSPARCRFPAEWDEKERTAAIQAVMSLATSNTWMMPSGRHVIEGPAKGRACQIPGTGRGIVETRVRILTETDGKHVVTAFPVEQVRPRKLISSAIRIVPERLAEQQARLLKILDTHKIEEEVRQSIDNAQLIEAMEFGAAFEEIWRWSSQVSRDGLFTRELEASASHFWPTT